MMKKRMIAELPFSFRNVGTLSSTSASVLAAPTLIIEDLYCMVGDVKIQVNFTRESERSEMLRRRQRARQQEKENPTSQSRGCCQFAQPMDNGIGDNFLRIPKGWAHDEAFIRHRCFPADWRETLKLWEIVICKNRLRFNFCDAIEPSRDKHNTRAAVELDGAMTLTGKFRAAAFRDESERLLFVRFGDDAAPGWGNFVEVATGTAKDGIVQTRFYPEADLRCFDKIVQSF